MRKILLFTIILYFFFGCSKSYSTQLEEGFTTKWIEEREGFKNKEDLKRIHWEISDVFEAQQESYVYDVKTENDSIYFRQEAFHGVECEGGGGLIIGSIELNIDTIFTHTFHINIKRADLGTRTCPFCLEEVDVQATVCKYCTSELEIALRTDEYIAFYRRLDIFRPGYLGGGLKENPNFVPCVITSRNDLVFMGTWRSDYDNFSSLLADCGCTKSNTTQPTCTDSLLSYDWVYPDYDNAVGALKFSWDKSFILFEGGTRYGTWKALENCSFELSFTNGDTKVITISNDNTFQIGNTTYHRTKFEY
jgi:hypothetical protein